MDPGLGPVAETDRIESLDVLRGVAVLGILVMNVQSFSMIGAAYINPTAYGDLEGINWWTWLACHVLADQKFMTIFSMLFGAGIVLMAGRREGEGQSGDCPRRGPSPSAPVLHYRRMAWLLVFGLLHAYLLWYGDILFTYALCGMAAFLFRRLRPWLLVVLGLASAAVASALAQAVGWGLASGAIPVDEMARAWTPPVEEIEKEIAAYRGGWLAQMPHRATAAIFFQTLLLVLGVAWRAGGMMLLGMALFKTGVLSGRRSPGMYASFIAVALVVGVPMIAYGAYRNVEAGWDVRYSFFLGGQWNYWGSIAVAMGWIGAVMLACRSARLRPALGPLAAVGRTALTCYLMQTVSCTTIFYGHGLGAFGRLERWEQQLVVLGVWALQLAAAPLWLRRFRFGPAEWLWRSLTYGRAQPFRRTAPGL
jgi:uncharacterized protein